MTFGLTSLGLRDVVVGHFEHGLAHPALERLIVHELLEQFRVVLH